MNSKIAALTVAFNEEKMIRPCCRQFKRPYLSEDIFHLVLVSKKPWRGEFEYEEATYKKARTISDAVVLGEWPTQAEQFNWGLSILHQMGFDWAIICDADEFYTSRGINELISSINYFDQETEIKIIRAPDMEVYWYSPHYRIENIQTDNPVVAMKTSEIFSDKRTPSLSEYGSTNARLHHFSYVRSDDEMIKKINSFEHSNEFDLNKWYEETWKNWILEKTNLHPVVPEQFARAIRKPAPQEIIDNYMFDQLFLIESTVVI